MAQKTKCLTRKIYHLSKESNWQKRFVWKKVRRNIKIRCAGKMQWRKVIEKLDIIENGKYFQTFLSSCSSKIERNCTLANTDINLQLPYYILELQENVFLGHPNPRGGFRYLSNIYDVAVYCIYILAIYNFRRSFIIDFWKGSEYASGHLSMSASTLFTH